MNHNKYCKNKKNIFLLGGKDLEMLTIKEILKNNGYLDITTSKDFSGSKCYADLGLKWGAKVIHYQDKGFFDFEGSIYGIELIEPEKWAKPKNYHAIDHHNDREKEKSSIEQVADILNIKLDRHQQLVALNDKGYIPAMEKFGASQEEINKIRFMDRQAQGVTTKDEELAEKSIEENLQKKGSIAIIKSLTSKFSPITDRRYGKDEHLIIYNADELNYYGPCKNTIVEYYKELIEKKHAYHGGGDNGYFGILNIGHLENYFDDIITTIIKIII